MRWYYLIIGYSFFALALGLLFYRLYLAFTGNSVSGTVTNIITKNRTITGNTNSRLIEISYKNRSGATCKFEADNGLLVLFYKIGDPIKLLEKNGKVIVSSLFNTLSAPAFIFLMGFVILALFA
jgi:hypothetical protein